MEGIFLCLHLLLLQYAVFPVTAQTVTLTSQGQFVENSPAEFRCDFTAAWDTTKTRRWFGPGSTTLITDGVATNTAKYSETTDSANQRFSMTIQNYNSADEGNYQCQYGFDTSAVLTLTVSDSEVHPSSSPLGTLTIPGAGEAIDLTIPVSGIRPAATASYNLTSIASSQTAIVSGNAVSTDTNDANGRTITSSLKIDVGASTTSVGNIFTITLVVGTYSDTKQWTITGTPSPTVPPKCSCSWLPCGWKCYYMYIIIVVVVVVLVVVTVSVCCCCRHGYCAFCACSACCRRKENEDKYHVDDVNLNNHKNGGRSNPSMHHDGTDM